MTPRTPLDVVCLRCGAAVGMPCDFSSLGTSLHDTLVPRYHHARTQRVEQKRRLRMGKKSSKKPATKKSRKSTQKTVDNTSRGDVSSTSSPIAHDAVDATTVATVAADSPALPDSHKEQKMDVTLTRSDKTRKSSSIVYLIDGHAGKSVKFSRGLFADKLGPTSGTPEEIFGALAAPRAARAKMTPEERKAARDARPKLTPEQKLAAIEARAAALRAKIAASANA